jgi:hypothetical protein
MAYHTIICPDQCPIKPEHIDVSRNFMSSVWQNMETEISANWLVRFAQHREHWMPFTIEDLESFYHEKFPGERFHFNKLTPDYIKELTEDDGWNRDWMAFTTEFVAACYAVSPTLEDNNDTRRI